MGKKASAKSGVKVGKGTKTKAKVQKTVRTRSVTQILDQSEIDKGGSKRSNSNGQTQGQ